MFDLYKPTSSQCFDLISLDVAVLHYKDNNFDSSEEKGLLQYGIDIYNLTLKVAIQSKNHTDGLAEMAIDETLEKLKNFPYYNELKEFIFTTPTKTDKNLESYVIEKSKKLHFKVKIWFSELILEILSQSYVHLHKHFPEFIVQQLTEQTNLKNLDRELMRKLQSILPRKAGSMLIADTSFPETLNCNIYKDFDTFWDHNQQNEFEFFNENLLQLKNILVEKITNLRFLVSIYYDDSSSSNMLKRILPYPEKYDPSTTDKINRDFHEKMEKAKTELFVAYDNLVDPKYLY